MGGHARAAGREDSGGEDSHASSGKLTEQSRFAGRSPLACTGAPRVRPSPGRRARLVGARWRPRRVAHARAVACAVVSGEFLAGGNALDRPESALHILYGLHIYGLYCLHVRIRVLFVLSREFGALRSPARCHIAIHTPRGVSRHRHRQTPTARAALSVTPERRSVRAQVAPSLISFT